MSAVKLSPGFVVAVERAAEECCLSLRDRVRFRLAMRFRPELVQEAMREQLVVEGLVVATATSQEIDWQGLLEQLIEMLPVILELLFRLL